MSITEANAILLDARSVLVLTGAGMSAESGVPTFRGGGTSLVWRGLPFEELSSASMVRENLPLVWEWFDYRRGVLADCSPNAGHACLAEVERSGRFGSFMLVTQNIDDLHRGAGSERVIELHGNIHKARCAACDRIDDMRELGEARPPVCLDCGSVMRPNVVLFGEYLPERAFERAMAAAEDCDVCLVVGTSALVAPASMLPAVAKAAGARVIEINPEETGLSADCDVSLRGKAAELLPQLFGMAAA